MDFRLIISAILLCVLSCPQLLRAQSKPGAPPQQVKVIDEHKDAKGNTIRTIQYMQGGSRVTETVITPPYRDLRVPVDPDTLNKDSVLIIVNKSKYLVEVYYRRKKIRTYKAVFGPKPMENKCREGDRCTPEGWFTVESLKPKSKYNKFMLLSYPNDSAKARFSRMKEKGQLPADAKIGGDVGIHGIWPGGDDMIEMGVCWTDGCVALKNKDMDDLYTLTGVGTRVYIRKQ